MPPGYNGRMSWELIGHEWAQALLQRHIAASTVRHAYLITGPAGIGKRTLALRFAQALNCTQAERAGELCQREDCRACQLTPLAAHPDLHLISPDGSIKIEEIRELQSKAALAPYEGNWRVALLTEFHLATQSAANALLKLLEEPPAKVVLVLTAPDPDSLPLTVVSRCETVALRAVNREVIAAALEDRGMEAAQAEFLAVLCGGRPGRALRLAEDPDLLERRQQALSDLRNLLGLGRIERFSEVPRLIGGGKLADQRERLSGLLEHWTSLWRDLMRAGYRAEVEPVNADVFYGYQQAAVQLTAERRAAALSALLRAQAAVEANANLRLTVEGLMLELPDLRPAGPSD